VSQVLLPQKSEQSLDRSRLCFEDSEPCTCRFFIVGRPGLFILLARSRYCSHVLRGRLWASDWQNTLVMGLEIAVITCRRVSPGSLTVRVRLRGADCDLRRREIIVRILINFPTVFKCRL
jgi:hypothetical protein